MSRRRESDSEAAERVKQQLLEAGFRLDREERRRWNMFGNPSMELSRGPLRIYIGYDRDAWELDIETPDGRFRDIESWHDVLRGRPPRALVPRRLADAGSELFPVLDELAARASAPDFDQTLDRMDEYERQRAQLMFPGIVITGPRDRGFRYADIERQLREEQER